MNNEHIEQEEKEKQIKKGSCVKLLVIVVLLIALIPVLIYIMLTWTTHYFLFTKERTERMEALFDITVTDDVKLLHYEDSSIFISIDQCLTLEVENYEQFMQNNIHADFEIDTFYSKEDILYYKYVNCNTYVEISPSENDGKYVVTLHHRE